MILKTRGVYGWVIHDWHDVLSNELLSDYIPGQNPPLTSINSKKMKVTNDETALLQIFFISKKMFGIYQKFNH